MTITEIVKLEIFKYSQEELNNFIQKNKFDDETKKFITIMIYSVCQENIKVLVELGWFSKEFIPQIKSNYFLILQLAKDFKIEIDNDIYLSCAKELILNHHPNKIYKYIINYIKDEKNRDVIKFIDKDGCSLLSYLVLTLEKNLVEIAIMLGSTTSIIDKNGYNLYDRVTLMSEDNICPHKVEEFINFMRTQKIPMENSQLQINEKNMRNRGYAYYQNIVREIKLKKQLQLNNCDKNHKTKV